MQCRRRHCYTRLVGLLALLGCFVLIVFVQNIWLTRLKSHIIIKRTFKKEAATPLSPTRFLGNKTLVSVRPAFRKTTRSNQSLAKEEKAESILKVEPYKYIINEPDRCSSNDTLLVLLIPVESHNSEARNAIRKTWGNESIANGIVRLFLLGVTHKTVHDPGKHELQQRTLREESQQYHDMIQQDYVDSYYNLTIKTLMGMHWVSRYCPSAKYVLKVDSDMFVNTEYLVHKFLNTSIPKEMYFTGYLMRGYKPNRNKDSKWYMPPELYPSGSYPTFCSGTGYLFSGDMAKRIYTTSLSIRRLHLEDVYVGLCLSKLNIRPMLPPNEFLFNHWRVSYSSCKYSQLITSHDFHPSELVRYWNHFQKNKGQPCKFYIGQFARILNPVKPQQIKVMINPG